MVVAACDRKIQVEGMLLNEGEFAVRKDGKFIKMVGSLKQHKPSTVVANAPSALQPTVKARENSRIADEVLKLFHAEHVEKVSVDITNVPYEQVELAIRLGTSVTKDRGPLNDSKSFKDLINEIERGPITFILRPGSSPSVDDIVVAALREPEKKMQDTLQREKRESIGLSSFPATEMLQVEWYHWAWIATAINKQNNTCCALRVDPKLWRETHKN